MLTSYSAHNFSSTMRDKGVQPSAASQMIVPTELTLKRGESTADMMIVSSPRMRDAIAELFAMYLSANGICYPINSHTRWSGKNESSKTGTASTKAQAD